MQVLLEHLDTPDRANKSAAQLTRAGYAHDSMFPRVADPQECSSQATCSGYMDFESRSWRSVRGCSLSPERSNGEHAKAAEVREPRTATWALAEFERERRHTGGGGVHDANQHEVAIEAGHDHKGRADVFSQLPQAFAELDSWSSDWGV